MRVSSPDRVVYEATDRTPAVTKLMVAQYFAQVEDGLMRALRDRPTALERWPAGVRPGIRLATGRPGEKADAFYQKRVPKGAPDYLESVDVTFPSGRTAAEICPTEIAVPVWCAQMGTLTFHPWPVRRADVDRPDELRIDLDPQPGTSFRDAARVAGVARELLDELGLVGFPKTSGNRGVHIHLRLRPEWDFVADVRGMATRGRTFSGSARGGNLRSQDAWLETCFHHSEGLLDVPRLRRLWRHLRELPRTTPDTRTFPGTRSPWVMVSGVGRGSSRRWRHRRRRRGTSSSPSLWG